MHKKHSGANAIANHALFDQSRTFSSRKFFRCIIIAISSFGGNSDIFQACLEKKHTRKMECEKMNEDELFDFAREWLRSWTGNDPDRLISYYSEDAFYSDPEHRDGLQGREVILSYFVKLLDVYRDWVWTPIELFPIMNGFVLKWKCTIYVGTRTLHEIGVDIVILKDNKIVRNEVYFDRTRLMQAIEELKKQERIIH